MKRNLLKLSIAALLIASFMGCSKDADVANQVIPLTNSLKSGWVPPTIFTDFTETEANNGMFTADGPVGIATKIIGKITNENDADFFKISCQANVPIYLFIDGSTYNLLGQIFDSTGRNLDLFSFNKLYTLKPTYTGYYYLLITGVKNVSYNVKLTATPELSETEPNNSMSYNDGPISVGTTAFGTVEVQAQCDWFSVNCTKGKIISLYLNANAIYVNAAIYDQSGTYIRAIDYDKPVLFYPQVTGTYYIVIGGYAGVSYSLKVESNPGFLNEKESNNTLNTANGPIYPGTYFSGSADGTSYDYVKIEQVQTGPISFYLEGTATYVNATIYNSSNQQLAFLLDRQSFVINELAAGTYYAKIGGYAGVGYKFFVNP